MTTRILNIMRIPYPFIKSVSCWSVVNRTLFLYNNGINDYAFQSKNMPRVYSTSKKPETAVSETRSETEVSMSVKEAVKETTKTVSYLGVIVVGVGVTCVIFYTIFKELFSSKSPNGVYTMSLKRCLDDNRVKDSLGEPIKGYGETTRRGRRRYTRHLAYEIDGVAYMRMQFYLKGSRNQGTVHLEMKEDANKDFKFRYLFVELDDYSRRIIVVEDNRIENTIPLSPPKDQIDLNSPLILS